MIVPRSLALAIILIAPVCLPFALGGVSARGMDNDLITQIGFVTLIGLAAKKAVLIARSTLDTAYRWLNDVLQGREWAAGPTFSLADCAAAPALFYADWVHPIGEAHANVRAYRRRLLARPSFARVVDEARPYRPLFPPGAPEHD